MVVWTKGEEEGEEEKISDDDAGDAGVLANEGLIGYNVVIMLIVFYSTFKQKSTSPCVLTRIFGIICVLVGIIFPSLTLILHS